MRKYIDMKELIHVVEPNSLDDIFNYMEACKQALPYAKEWIYRGQSNHRWDLTTSLERQHTLLQKSPATAINIHALESCIWEQATPSIEEKLERTFNSKVEKSAIFQHYGIQTRLLDFTKSLDVGLFFATEDNTQTKNALYVLNYTYLRIATAWRMTTAVRTTKNVDLPEASERYFDEGNDFMDGVLLVDPKIESKRIKAQDGCFLLPSNINESTRINVNKCLSGYTPNSAEPTFFKFLIDESLGNEVRKYLRSKGVTKDSLFPQENDGLQKFIDELKAKLSFKAT